MENVSAGAVGAAGRAVAGSPSAGRASYGARIMFKAVLKTFALLIILFVMLYVGMNNTHVIDFHFPVAGTTTQAPIHASAALVYFGIFAVGVLAGTMLHSSGGGGKKSGGSKEK